MKKILIQIILLLLIVIICIITYQKYFKEDIIIRDNTVQQKPEDLNNSSNLIKNLKYDVKFENNTQYSISSELSEILYIDQNEIVLMQEVIAIFIDKEGSKLKISSNNAEYNNSSYNSVFENDVKIVYMDHIIKSEKLFLDFEKNFIIISDNIVYEGLQGLVKADNIEINLITKSINIFMNNNQDKIEINSKKER